MRGEAGRSLRRIFYRMPDGTFAPKGRGRVLSPSVGDTIRVQHRDGPSAGTVKGRVLVPGVARLEEGPDKGLAVQVRASEVAGYGDTVRPKPGIPTAMLGMSGTYRVPHKPRADGSVEVSLGSRATGRLNADDYDVVTRSQSSLRQMGRPGRDRIEVESSNPETDRKLGTGSTYQVRGVTSSKMGVPWVELEGEVERRRRLTRGEGVGVRRAESPGRQLDRALNPRDLATIDEWAGEAEKSLSGMSDGSASLWTGIRQKVQRRDREFTSAELDALIDQFSEHLDHEGAGDQHMRDLVNKLQLRRDERGATGAASPGREEFSPQRAHNERLVRRARNALKAPDGARTISHEEARRILAISRATGAGAASPGRTGPRGIPVGVHRRTFEAKKHPAGSPERRRLNEDPRTSEYQPSHKYAVVSPVGMSSYRTKAEAEQAFERSPDRAASPGRPEGNVGFASQKAADAYLRDHAARVKRHRAELERTGAAPGTLTSVPSPKGAPSPGRRPAGMPATAFQVNGVWYRDQRAYRESPAGRRAGAASPGRDPVLQLGDPPAILDSMAEDPRWLGYGYLGYREDLGSNTTETREYPGKPSVRKRVDRAVVAAANELGWNREQLFHWANSKNGRWYAEENGGFRRTTKAAQDKADAIQSMRQFEEQVVPAEIPSVWEAAKRGEVVDTPRPSFLGGALSPGRPSGGGFTARHYEVAARALRALPPAERDGAIAAMADVFAQRGAFQRDRFERTARGELGGREVRGQFTRRDFEAVADMLREGGFSPYAHGSLARSFADAFGRSNERFDRERFLRAAGAPTGAESPGRPTPLTGRVAIHGGRTGTIVRREPTGDAYIVQPDDHPDTLRIDASGLRPLSDIGARPFGSEGGDRAAARARLQGGGGVSGPLRELERALVPAATGGGVGGREDHISVDWGEVDDPGQARQDLQDFVAEVGNNWPNDLDTPARYRRLRREAMAEVAAYDARLRRHGAASPGRDLGAVFDASRRSGTYGQAELNALENAALTADRLGLDQLRTHQLRLDANGALSVLRNGGLLTDLSPRQREVMLRLLANLPPEDTWARQVERKLRALGGGARPNGPGAASPGRPTFGPSGQGQIVPQRARLPGGAEVGPGDTAWSLYDEKSVKVAGVEGDRVRVEGDRFPVSVHELFPDEKTAREWELLDAYEGLTYYEESDNPADESHAVDTRGQIGLLRDRVDALGGVTDRAALGRKFHGAESPGRDARMRLDAARREAAAAERRFRQPVPHSEHAARRTAFRRARERLAGARAEAAALGAASPGRADRLRAEHQAATAYRSQREQLADAVAPRPAPTDPSQLRRWRLRRALAYVGADRTLIERLSSGDPTPEDRRRLAELKRPYDTPDFEDAPWTAGWNAARTIDALLPPPEEVAARNALAALA